METIEERALREKRLEFVRRLDVNDYVLDFILQKGALTDIAGEYIRAEPNRPDRASALIDRVLQKAIIPTFIEGLQFNNSHQYLANMLIDKIESLKSEDQSRVNGSNPVTAASFDYSFPSSFSAVSGSGSIYRRSRTESGCRDEVDPDATSVMKLFSRSVRTDGDGSSSGRRSLDSSSVQEIQDKVSCEFDVKPTKTEVPHEINDIDETEEGEDKEEETKVIIHQPPRKVDIMDRKKKLLTRIHYHLKLLSHDGKKEEFNKFVSKHKTNYIDDADIMFTLLDAEVESRRLVYDTGLHKGDIFDDMEKCINSSSHPVANTMTFLARKGSARTMKESLEVGLHMLEEAVALSEHVKPCKDTGMVLYILINILIQIYEKEPTVENKEKIIRKIDEAINVHFAEGPPFLREDYTRMLYLKMVFCYLGIGLFGKIIDGCVVSDEDMKSAETCLQIIDSSHAKFDNRRRMFYFMAKSVLYRKRGAQSDALEFAEMAKRKAKRCGFNKELGPILDLTGEIKLELYEKDCHEIDARELDIETELRALESDNVLIKRVLSKPSNQWGEPTEKKLPLSAMNVQLQISNPSEVHRTTEKILCVLVLLLTAASCFVTYNLFTK